MSNKLAFLALLLSACSHVPCSEPSLLSQVNDATVFIEEENGTGSGTVISSHNGSLLILTCAHVAVHGGLFISSRTLSGVPARLVKIDEGHDLALIAADVRDAHYPSLRIAQEEIPLYGRLYMMGSPDGIYGSATQGFLIRKDFITPVKVGGKLVTHTFWLVEGAMLIPGISGGTGVDKHGDLQCVPAAGGIPQIGMCVGLADIKTFLKGISL